MVNEKIKKLIFEQLKLGACNRIHLHRECSRKFNLKPPRADRSHDKKFDDMLEELLTEKKIRILQIMTINTKDRKIQFEKPTTIKQIGHYTFYEINPNHK